MATEPDHRPQVIIPWAFIVAVVLVIVGIALLCYGIYILAGVGWTALVACVPFFLLALVIFRGLQDG